MSKRLNEGQTVGRVGRSDEGVKVGGRLVNLIRLLPARKTESRGFAQLWPLFARLAERRGYLFLSLATLIFAVAQAAQGHWSQKSDFWGHSAAVRELAAHPLDPSHPLLLVDRPDTFLTPYTLTVAVFSRWFDLSPVTALSVVGIANLILLLIALRLFVMLLLGRRSVAFWALLFALLVWGWLPWSSSGFLNLMSIASVAPYPSTFAYALTLLALSAVITLLRGGSPTWAIAVLAAQTLVLLSHPPTAIVLYVGVGVLCLTHLSRARLGACLVVAVASLASILLALAWPYFSVFLASAKLARWDQNNHWVYENVVPRTLLALLAVPILLARFWEDRRDFIAVTFVALAAIYLYGAIQHRFAYGRVLAFMVLLLQIVMADLVDRLVTQRREALQGALAAGRAMAPAGRRGMIIAAIVALGFIGQVQAIVPAIPSALLPDSIRYRNCCVDTQARYSFLSRVGQYDVVLAETWPSWVTPTLGGKSVAVPFPLAFVEDLDVRRRDVLRFFDTAATVELRKHIIRKYKISYVLVERNEARSSFALEAERGSFGSVVYADPRFILVKAS
jgi:hypothetical protein